MLEPTLSLFEWLTLRESWRHLRRSQERGPSRMTTFQRQLATLHGGRLALRPARDDADAGGHRRLHFFRCRASSKVNRVAEVLNRRTSKAMIFVGRARKIGPSTYCSTGGR